MTDDYHRYFKIFTKVSKAIHTGTSTREILECIVENITEITYAKGCIFWIINEMEQKIETMISHGFTYQSLAGVDYETLINIFDPREEKDVFIEDARYDERIPDLERLGKKRVGSVTGMFFNIAGPYRGILAIYFTNFRKLEPDEQELVTALGEQGAIALNRALNNDGERHTMLRQIVEGFALALEAKDGKSHGHSLKVACFARLTAKELGLSKKEVEIVYHAGILHDIGKIGMEDRILDKLGSLSVKEMKIVKKHPVIGAGILKPLTFFHELEPLILHHHERFDGSGYPKKLKGEKIPMGARIIAVCDAFETMISGRAHMKKLPLNQAIAGLQKGANLYFDPKVIRAFFSMIEKNPKSIGTTDSVEKYFEKMRQNIDDIGAENLIKKRMEMQSSIFF